MNFETFPDLFQRFKVVIDIIRPNHLVVTSNRHDGVVGREFYDLNCLSWPTTLFGNWSKRGAVEYNQSSVVKADSQELSVIGNGKSITSLSNQAVDFLPLGF